MPKQAGHIPEQSKKEQYLIVVLYVLQTHVAILAQNSNKETHIPLEMTRWIFGSLPKKSIIGWLVDISDSNCTTSDRTSPCASSWLT